MAIRTIELLLHGDASQAIGQMEKLATATATSADTMHAKVSAMASKIVLATAAAGIGIAAISVKLADDYEKAHASLLNSLKDTGQNYDTLKASIQGTVNQGQKFGENQIVVETLLARGNAVLGSNAKAQQALSMAQDFSAKTGKDLTTSYVAAEKALQGNVTALQRAGIYLPVVGGTIKQVQSAQDALTKAQEAGKLVEEKIADGRLKGVAATDAAAAAYKRIADAQDKLGKTQAAGTDIAAAWNAKFGGAAQAQADTFAGKVKALQTTLENLGIKIGQAIIPVLETMATALGDVINWFEKNKGAAEALGIAVGVVLAGALAIFTYDKAVAFIGGLQRIGTALGIMGGEATAAGGEVAAAGTPMLAILGPLALVAGGVYGLYTAFNDNGLAIDVNAQKLQSLNATALQPWVNKLIDASAKIGNGTEVTKAFNQILDKSPQSAQLFINAVQNAGQSTDHLRQMLINHNVAAEEAKIATQRLGLEQQLTDAKVRGDAASVYGLTLQLAALPTNKQVEVALHAQQAIADAAELHNILAGLPSVVNVAVNVGSSISAGARALYGG